MKSNRVSAASCRRVGGRMPPLLETTRAAAKHYKVNPMKSTRGGRIGFEFFTTTNSLASRSELQTKLA